MKVVFEKQEKGKAKHLASPHDNLGQEIALACDTCTFVTFRGIADVAIVVLLLWDYHAPYGYPLPMKQTQNEGRSCSCCGEGGNGLEIEKIVVAGL